VEQVLNTTSLDVDEIANSHVLATFPGSWTHVKVSDYERIFASPEHPAYLPSLDFDKHKQTPSVGAG
jgi:hypothetical protein